MHFYELYRWQEADNDAGTNVSRKSYFRLITFRHTEIRWKVINRNEIKLIKHEPQNALELIIHHTATHTPKSFTALFYCYKMPHLYVSRCCKRYAKKDVWAQVSHTTSAGGLSDQILVRLCTAVQVFCSKLLTWYSYSEGSPNGPVVYMTQFDCWISVIIIHGPVGAHCTYWLLSFDWTFVLRGYKCFFIFLIIKSVWQEILLVSIR